jgi:hypothetical protein
MVSIKTTRLALALVLSLVASAAFAGGGALTLVPGDAVSVGVVRVADLRTSPLSSTLFQHADKFGTDGEAARFLAEAGLDLAKDIDLLVVATSPKTRLGSEAEIVVLAEGRFNVERLSSALTARGAVRKTSAAGGYFGLPESDDHDHTGAVAFPDGTMAIAGTEQAVIAALQARRSGNGGFAQSGLGMELGRIDAKASAWALVDVIRAARLTGGHDRLRHSGNNAQGQAMNAAIRNISTVGVWATDTGEALNLGGFGLANDAETLQLVEDTLRGALSAMRLTVKDRMPDMVSVLRGFEVKRSDQAVTVTGSIPAEALRKLMAMKQAKK